MRSTLPITVITILKNSNMIVADKVESESTSVTNDELSTLPD